MDDSNSLRVWRPDGTTVRQATITSNEAQAGNDVAEGRLQPDAYWPAVVAMYQEQLAHARREISALKSELSALRHDARP